MEKVVLVDPTEFGIEKKKAGSIESAFLPKKVETDGFVKVYESILSKEVNKDTCKEARELRLKLVKVRGGIRDIHTAEKAFYLASGKYVDALKNKLTLPISQMEEKLTEIEKYFENQEKEIAKALRIERESKLEQFGTDTTFIALDLMSVEQFADLFDKEKIAFETRKAQEEEAERTRLENERLDKLESDRRIASSYIALFMPADFDYRSASEDEYHAAAAVAIEKQEAHNKQIEEQRAELDKIKAEQEAKDKKEREQREAKQKIQSDRLKLIHPFNKNASNLNLSDLSEKDFKALLTSSKKEHEEMKAIIASQEEAKKEKADREEKERKAKLAPDVDKLRDLYSRLKGFDLPEVSSDDAKEAIRKFKSGVENVLRTLAEDAKKLK